MSVHIQVHVYNNVHVFYLFQGGSAEIKLSAGDKLILSIEDKYHDCGTNDIIYIDYKNIVNVSYIVVGM